MRRVCKAISGNFDNINNNVQKQQSPFNSPYQNNNSNNSPWGNTSQNVTRLSKDKDNFMVPP